MRDILGVLAFFIAIVMVIAAGDRLGMFAARRYLQKRPSMRPLLHLPNWLHFSVVLAIPSLIFIGALFVMMRTYDHNPIWMLADNVIFLLPLVLFLVGVIGGFLARAK
jgi:hypothetical protein